MSVNTLPILPKNGRSELPFELGISEKLKYRTSTERQSMSIKLENSTASININAKDGSLYLTNKRLVFITANEGDIDVFALELATAPALQLSHSVRSPWFGANYWEFLIFTNRETCDGFPDKCWLRGIIKFNDGGLFDFVQVFNEALNDVMNNADIDEELPLYSA
ncbi:hypothetical protein HYPBUDRAFT_152576 [Hyphopichia burtonii NRRL Y-1933]|uniref:Uncharacterized protein n=1 Tax=Hyphopichia burtonii NRRL Y-1933 TaxID=984485 RepID=A0A1E4RL31_9ASCO|nr:hypothetical protein HYPBUDRAFT_152576 [Hyphopichia burtonii NRRL Y-1933]ODV67795.1 hypothetical protein HYPBUDRAFT_152576 [Hyphopichia burtonii NRRL Y-1933]